MTGKYAANPENTTRQINVWMLARMEENQQAVLAI
jgi:hypothetical protein